MKCPLCKSREKIAIDLHADGFSQDARECGACGAIWTFCGDALKIIQGRRPEGAASRSGFICPTCKSIDFMGTALDAFQFHEKLLECTHCGTICSSAHGQLEIVRDSQRDSFLSATSDCVESDDYVFI